MDLVVGDRVKVIRNINVRFMIPENEYIYYILFPDEEYTVIEADDYEMILLLGEGTNPMGAEVSYDDRDKIIKI